MATLRKNSRDIPYICIFGTVPKHHASYTLRLDPLCGSYSRVSAARTTYELSSKLQKDLCSAETPQSCLFGFGESPGVPAIARVFEKRKMWQS